MSKRIIPCLDVKDGRVVKGVHFVHLRDAGDPVELAALYDKEKADELVFLDISATQEGRATMVDVVRKTADNISIPLTVGGGIANPEQMANILQAGADKVAVNSAALTDPNLLVEGARKFGSCRIVAAIDARYNPEWKDWEVYTHGGNKATGKRALEWAVEVQERGAGEILLTSMDKDGTKDGFDLELTRAIADRVSIPVIASGGAGTREHFYDVLTEGKADGGLAASVFHYKDISIAELKAYLRDRGVKVS